MSDEKNEAPTEHKLREARKRGEAPKSRDLATACSLLAVLVTLNALAGDAGARLRRIVMLGLDFQANDSLQDIALYRTLGQMALQAGMIVVPLLLVAALFAALGYVVQIGIVVAMEAVTPKIDNVDPVKGFKKVFSVKSLLTFGQMVLKAVVLAVVIWQVIVALLPMVGAAPYQSPGGVAAIGWSAIYRLLLFALAIFIVLGPIDYAIVRHQFMKSQRMSKDDIKQEYKGQEGDPELKGKRKQIAKEDAQSNPRKAVAGASAVIVNPTHYAVAVRYRPEEFGLPLIVAKGLDAQALAIRRYADAANVPIFSNPPLARALHKAPLGAPVPEELFEAVAVVLRWIDRLADESRLAGGVGGANNKGSMR